MTSQNTVSESNTQTVPLSKRVFLLTITTTTTTTTTTSTTTTTITTTSTPTTVCNNMSGTIVGEVVT